MSVKIFTVKTTLVAKTCALNALPICRFMESIPTTSQPMMKKQCRKQYKRPATGRGRPNAGVWEKAITKFRNMRQIRMDVCMTTRTNMKRKDIYIFSWEKATGQPGTEKGKRTCPWSAWIVTSITFMAAENKNALPLGVSRYFRIWGDVLRFGALPSWLLKTRVRYLWYF